MHAYKDTTKTQQKEEQANDGHKPIIDKHRINTYYTKSRNEEPSEIYEMYTI